MRMICIGMIMVCNVEGGASSHPFKFEFRFVGEKILQKQERKVTYRPGSNSSSKLSFKLQSWVYEAAPRLG